MIDTLIRMSSGYPDGGDCEILIEWLYGAFVDVSEMGSAFFHRTAGARVVFSACYKYNDELWKDWVAPYETFFLSKCVGVCTNYGDTSLSPEDFPRLYWSDNYEDLQKTKEDYDPQNFFSYVQSVVGNSVEM